jgi:hypothetical protein
MKLFAKERKRIRRVAHEKHTRFYDDPSFSEVYEDRLYPIMEPVFAAMSKATSSYHCDILQDYDLIKKKLSEDVEENSLVYVIGIRDCGTDGTQMIEAMYDAEPQTFASRYPFVFWFFACVDTDTVSGEPIRFIDVYMLDQTKK